MEKEMQDFIRSIGGATDAIDRFRESLEVVGGGSDSASNQSSSNSDSNNSVDAPKAEGWRLKAEGSKSHVDLKQSFADSSTARSQAQLDNKKDVVTSALSPQPSALVDDAVRLNQQLLKDKRTAKIDLPSLLVGQDTEGFDLDVKNLIRSQSRQFKQQEREGTKNRFGWGDRVFGFKNDSQLPTASVEAEQSIRQKVTEFRDFGIELTAQKQQYQDTFDTLTNLIAKAPNAIAELREAGNEKMAAFLEATLAQAQGALPLYEKLLGELAAFETQLPKLEKNATDFLRRQGELRVEAEKLNKRSQISTIKTNIATQRGTSELRRQNEILSEQLRLKSEINRIRLETADPVLAEELIGLETQQSKINEQNINREAYDRDVAYEQKLLDMDSGIKNTKGDLLSGFGFDFAGNKLKREAAISQENFRFQNELIQLKREYGADPEKLNILIAKAKQLNEINLEQIKQQFKSLGQTLIDLGRANLGSFFESAMEGIFNRGDKERELREQELQYREELLEVENQYKDNPSSLDFARDRIKKLNEEKLDKIRGELNLFNTVVNAGKQAVINLLKEIARMAAQKLAANIIGSIVGSMSGGAGGAAGSAFTASDGITVPNFLKGGLHIKRSLSEKLQAVSKPIRQAIAREGSKGVLGVFTPGEEILSIKTGEAGRYQSLKKQLGTEPLEKIFQGNFANGGTVDIEGNLLRQLTGISSPKISLNGVSNKSGKTNSSVQNITNFSATVVTPNADSFRASNYQTQQDIAEALMRARR